MENLFTGYTTFRKRKFPLLWTGEVAEHVHDTNAVNNNEPLHLEIQKALQGALNVKFSTGIVGVKEFGGSTIEIIWQLKSNKAMIKTAHRKQSTTRLLLKNRGIEGTKKKKPILFTESLIDDDTRKWLNLNNMPISEYVKVQNKYLALKKK